MAYVLDHVRYRVESQSLTRRPMRTGPLSGHIFVHELLQGHEARAYENLRMAPRLFLKLRDVLINKGLMKDTTNLTCTEQLAIFLHALGHGVSNRVLSERFHHSGETISRHFNAVLKVVVSLKREYINLAQNDVQLHPHVRHNKIFYPYFKNAVRAIDGTHIPALVRKNKATRYRNRKGWISQNVMATCSFDLQFQYVAVGWEGSTADMRVLRWHWRVGVLVSQKENIIWLTLDTRTLISFLHLTVLIDIICLSFLIWAEVIDITIQMNCSTTGMHN
ncbi:hypothetical protein QJS04_geneDACA017808 [Acorus gramineus]|uniref:DUF8040 domain-containing protein n=1 Tax=Acorus gramineus TaxID=55184 RepID=A0AAV9BLQ6_ACOGR|nr:hypothetical protein QJS04_geneDACA017808 [Acorus gramineus]